CFGVFYCDSVPAPRRSTSYPQTFGTASTVSFKDTALPAIYPLSLHDALPISPPPTRLDRTAASSPTCLPGTWRRGRTQGCAGVRSEEHTSELQSREKLVCRLPLEKKNEITCLANVSHTNDEHI